MKKVVKGIIVVFSVLLIGCVGLLIFGLTGRGSQLFHQFGERVIGQKLMHTETLDAAGLKGLTITTGSEDIIFRESESSSIVVKEYVSGQAVQKPFIDYERDGAQLNLTVAVKNRQFLVIGNNSRDIAVYLPKSYQGTVTVETGSGEISGSSLKIADNLDITAASGDITLKNVTAAAVRMSTQSGDIALSSLIGKTNQLHTASGEIVISKVSGDTDCQTSSGDTTIEQVDGDFRVKTSSGEATVGQLNGKVEAESSSGDLNLGFAAIGGDVSIESSSGEVWLGIPKAAAFTFTAHTGSGDVDVDDDLSGDELLYNKDGDLAKTTIGTNPQYQITVKTASGDVDLQWAED